MLFIDDDGPGIPEADYQEALSPSYVLNHRVTNKQAAQALAYLLPLMFVLSHGGNMTLHTSPLGGLRVMIKLPI